MGHQVGDVVAGEAVALHYQFGDVGHAGNGVLEDGAAVLIDVVLVVVDGFEGNGIGASAGFLLQVLPAAPINRQFGVEDAVARFAGLQQHTARAVAKEHAGIAVLVVDPHAHGVGPYHQHALMGARLDELRSGTQGKEKARAGGIHVKAPGLGGAQFVGDEVGRSRIHVVGRHRSADDQVEVLQHRLAPARDPAITV